MKGRNLKMIAGDVAEGYLTVNPIFLRPFDGNSLKELYQEVMKKQAEVRAEKFPYSDIQAIRIRNMRLQRLHQAAFIIRNFARERRTLLI